MNRKYLRLAASLIIAPASLAVMAEITLPPLLTDNMVIQRDTEAPLWGTATPGATVTITPSWGKSVPVSTVAAADGRWMTKVATPAAGGPYTITIAEGKTDRVTLKNVMSGEVWLCSGQSNMDMPLHGWGTIFDHEREIAWADNPGLQPHRQQRPTGLPLPYRRFSDALRQPRRLLTSLFKTTGRCRPIEGGTGRFCHLHQRNRYLLSVSLRQLPVGIIYF